MWMKCRLRPALPLALMCAVCARGILGHPDAPGIASSTSVDQPDHELAGVYVPWTNRYDARSIGSNSSFGGGGYDPY